MFFRFPLLITLFVGIACSSVQGADAPPTTPRHVLFFSKSAGFEHSVIKRNGSELSYVETVLARIGPANGIEFTFSKDGSVFTPENIAKYDAFVFFTTGDLTKTTGDGNPAMTREGKDALLDAIRKGKGFVGTHSASDTFHTAGSPFQNNGADVDPFIAMLGGEFITHDKQQQSHVTCADPKFPGMTGIDADFDWVEEWYSLKNFAPDLHVLLVQHTAGMAGNAFDASFITDPNDPTSAYMYQNDEAWHGGVHRWKITGLNTIKEQVATLSPH